MSSPRPSRPSGSSSTSCRAAETFDEADRKAVTIVARNIERLESLVNDVLEVARMGAGRVQMDRARVDLARVAADAVDAFGEAARQAEVTLELRGMDALPIEGDANRLTQVMFNLLGNALKFTPSGGIITVEGERKDGQVVVRVRDTGIGIPKEDIPRLFQPFSQVTTPGSRQTGTGLGLHISKGIVELHGGSIWCESDGAGKGTTMVFALPAA